MKFSHTPTAYIILNSTISAAWSELQTHHDNYPGSNCRFSTSRICGSLIMRQMYDTHPLVCKKKLETLEVNHGSEAEGLAKV